jgi:hypothetical protein
MIVVGSRPNQRGTALEAVVAGAICAASSIAVGCAAAALQRSR